MLSEELEIHDTSGSSASNGTAGLDRFDMGGSEEMARLTVDERASCSLAPAAVAVARGLPMGPTGRLGNGGNCAKYGS